MIVFEKAGKDNTEETIKIAVERAQKLNTSIVIASNTGYTAGTLVRFLEENKIELPVVVVTAVYGMPKPGENQFPEDQRKELKSKGVEIVTAAHALSGAERSFSNRFHGQGPIEIMAHTLRMLSQGRRSCAVWNVCRISGRYGKRRGFRDRDHTGVHSQYPGYKDP